MNNKGVTIPELLLVIIVFSTIVGFATFSINSILLNSRKKVFLYNAELILELAMDAHLQNENIWNDNKVTLSELISEGYLEPLENDPWSGLYNQEETYVTTELITVNDGSYYSRMSTYFIYKTRIVSTSATIGYNTPLESFNEDDIVIIDFSNDSLIERVKHIFTGKQNTSVTTGEAHDEITIDAKLTGSAKFDTGNGDDIINVEYGMIQNSSIFSGEGNDFVTSNKAIAHNSKIDTADGNDYVTINGNTLGNSLINSGEGDDTIEVKGSLWTKSRIDSGPGNDTITVSGQVKNYSSIKTGEGNDSVTINGKMFNDSTLDTGDGNDTVSAKNEFSGRCKVYTGNGDDTISVSDNIRWNAYIDMGPGNDSITVSKTVQESPTIKTGAGNDNITIGRVWNNFTGNIDVGSGDDTVRINTFLAKGGTINGGTGYDVLHLPGVTLSKWDEKYKSLFKGFEKVHLKDVTFDIIANSSDMNVIMMQ